MDDDEGGFFNMFGGDEDDGGGSETQPSPVKAAAEPPVPQKLRHDGCPVEDPRNLKVRVMYEGELFPATIKSYQPDSDTYTIMWTSSGVLQYRTKPSEINWEAFVEIAEEKKEVKKEEDELWIAARRGSLNSVKQFVESGVNFNETGTFQQRTPFYHAVFCGHLAVAEYLIGLGARDSDDTAFITANAEMRELLLRTGAGGKPRRASIRKSLGSKPVDAEVKTELRRKSISKAASSNVHPLEGQVSPAQLEALKQLEERLLAVEAAVKTETRRQSVALKKAASQAKMVKSDQKSEDSGATAGARKKSQATNGGKSVTFDGENSGKKTAKKDEKAIVVASKKTKSGSLLFRVLTVFLPRRLFTSKKKAEG